MPQAEIGSMRVRMTADAGDFERGTKRAEKNLSDFGRAVQRISDRITDASFSFNSGMRSAERFSQAVRSIVGVAGEFSSGMSSVATLVDTNTENMKEMTAAVLAIGRKVPVALTDLTGGLYDLRSAGTVASDAMERLERSAKLGVAGLGSTKEAVDLVTSSINAFGLKGEEADQVYNNIFKTIQAGKTTISGLAQGFGAVAGTVATAGIKLDEYLSSVAALTVTGIPAAQAHTMIRAAIAGLTRESEVGTRVLDALGSKTFKQLVEKSGGMVGAFKNITKALGGNEQEMIKLLGSIEAYGAMIALTGKQNDAFNQTMVNMRNGVDTVGEAFEKKNAGMNANLQRMHNAISDLGIALGGALAPAIAQVTKIVVGLTDAFRSLSPETQETVAAIAALAAVGGPAVIALGFFANAIVSLLPAISAVGGAIMAVIAATGPIGLFIAAAAAASAAWFVFEGDIKHIWDNVVTTITESTTTTLQKIQGWVGAVGSLVQGKPMQAIEFLKLGFENTGAAASAAAAGTDNLTTSLKAVDKAAATVGANAWTYMGPVVQSTQAAADAKKALNDAERERQRIIEEMRTPEEEQIARIQKLNELFTGAARQSVTYGRAMAQASTFSAKNMDALASSVSSNLSTIFGETKGVAIATALINTFQGITKALATYPPPLAQIMAGIQAAAGFAQVANIRRQTSKGGGGGGGDGGGGGAAAAASAGAAAPVGVQQSLMVQGIRPDQFISGDVVKALAGKLLDFQRDGGKVVLQ
jgi:TP901 family phage tail tape measure protein